MIDVEFRIISDHREGLLLSMGQIVMASGFEILRPKITSGDEGIVLLLTARGPEQRLLELQDRLGSHPSVRSFEARLPGVDAAAPAAKDPADTAVIAAATEAMPDRVASGTLLPQLARDYPNIATRLMAFERNLEPAKREATMRYVGTRVGTWLYKRDYALGARLNLADSLRQIALPALRQWLGGVEAAGESVRVAGSPFASAGLHQGNCCHFIRGELEGLLNEPGHLGRLQVVESACRNNGASACVFDFKG